MRMASKAISVPAPGFEDICAAEAKELGFDAKAENGVVSFSGELLQVCEYIYRAQTPERVILELLRCGTDNIVEEIKKIQVSVPKGTTFVVRADVDTEDIEKQEISQDIGALIVEKTGAKVEFKRPQTTFLVLVRKGICHFGIDVSGEDLGRRDFRIFLGPQALKGHVAASLVRLAGIDAKKVILDPFCKNGIIPIETALQLAKRSPHFFGKEKFNFRRMPEFKTDWGAFFEKIDKDVQDVSTKIISMDPLFNHISAAKKNAKIAGVNKNIIFSRTDLEFLDAKFGKHAIDTMITLPPQTNVNLPPDKAEKLIKDVFYQAEFVMKKGGTCLMVTQSGADLLKKYAAEFKFTLKHERTVWQGKAELKVLVFER